jgi:YHYH protein
MLRSSSKEEAMFRPRRIHAIVPLALCAAVTAVTAVAMGDASPQAGSSSVNAAFLPLGDGKVTTSDPRRGYVYSCGSGLAAGGAGGGPPGGGAQVEGPWIHGSTFDLNAKATVDGSVKWPSAKLREKTGKSRRTFSGNGLPRGDTTGEFPVRSSDDAYSYDRNPNSIRSQSVHYSLPTHPRAASKPSCLPMGAIGIAKNGVAIFNALDAGDRDAVAHEVQDSCGGHPQMSGVYHYHDIPSCLTKGESKHRASGLVGYALDGYPIFGPRGHGGKLLTNNDLDACHGQVSKVFYEGRWQRIYHYSATLEYPYTLGCFHGTPQV